jgi:hypothetical protein
VAGAGSSRYHACDTTSGEYDGKRVIWYSGSGRTSTLINFRHNLSLLLGKHDKQRVVRHSESGEARRVSSASRTDGQEEHRQRGDQRVNSGAASRAEHRQRSKRSIASELSSQPSGASAGSRAASRTEHRQQTGQRVEAERHQRAEQRPGQGEQRAR